MKSFPIALALLLDCACCAGPARADESFLVVDAAGRIERVATHAAPQDPNATTVGDFYAEPSTLHSLGFEWNIQGDDNRNGRVAVEYRRAGESTWNVGQYLLRIHGEQVAFREPKLAYTCGNLYAGSILFLEPATAYEVKLTLDDPDGGHAEKRLQMPTKTLPRMFEGGRKLHVYPPGFAGAKADPAFGQLAEAYAACQPGDVIALHAGDYSGNYRLDKSATRERPIVIRDAGDGPVILSGNGNFLDVTGSRHHWIHGLTFRGGSGAICNAPGDAGAHGLTVTRCRFEDCYAGVFMRSTSPITCSWAPPGRGIAASTS